MCSRVLDHRRHPVDPALEPPDAQARVAVEDAAEDVLAERVPERRHRLEHADVEAVELVRRRRRVLADVMGHRHLRRLDRVPHAVHRGARVVDRPLVLLLARAERQQERLQPERLQLVDGPAGALGVPPVDEADAEDAALRSLLHLGDVLVVDPEAELADLAVGPAEQGEDRVGERQLLGDALRVEGREPGVDVARVRARQRVVLREHLDELGHEDGLAVHAEHPAAVDVHDPRRAGPSCSRGSARRRCPRPARCGCRPRTPRCRPEGRAQPEAPRPPILRRSQALRRVRQRHRG